MRPILSVARVAIKSGGFPLDMARGAARYFGTVATIVVWGFAEQGWAGLRVRGEQLMTGVKAWQRAIVLLLIALFWLSSRAAESCTLWAAVGEATRDGGSLVAKNRDWRPDHRQEVKRVTPKQGFRYYGLFATGNEEPGLKAGVNEKGLVVVSATAPYWRRELKAIRWLFVWPTPEKTSAKSASRARTSSGGEVRWHPREAPTVFSSY